MKSKEVAISIGFPGITLIAPAGFQENMPHNLHTFQCSPNIPIMHAHDISKQIPQEKKFFIMLKML